MDSVVRLDVLRPPPTTTQTTRTTSIETPLPTVIGSAYLTLVQLTATLTGQLVLPIYHHHQPSIANAPPRVCGSISLTYTVAKPCFAIKNTLEHVYRTYWSYTRKRTLDVGHRGLGKSQHKSRPEYRLVGIKENSLMSFIVAGHLGADFIEFDVLLTKDRIPIIYHDFELNIQLEEEIEGKDHLVVGIHQMTWRKLTRAKTDFKSRHPFKLGHLIKRHLEDILKLTENGRRLLVERKKRHLKENKWGTR